ncbi:RNA polymerase sigma factor [Streptomyces sp. TLI_105]|uniref:RNA polymerase sigma factor n=1 Tax=Streptomyces sp. TLI_105 TaxID=1881019 RepID=UPI000899B0DE|nr:sigma factor [Streptomyces sp. TLI_105]SEE59520.1 RNA polymerase sigma-70 factor, ECF subfamily [Streptomyces sp. TLI_105]
MVADDQAPGAARPVVDADLLQRLRDCYETFMEAEPRILRRKTNRRLSYQACQDVAHEAYLKVARKVMSGQLGPEVQLSAYLRRTSRNLAIDTLRVQTRLEPLDDTGLVPAVPSQRQPADDFDPLEELVVPTIDAMPLSRPRKVVQLQSQGLTDTQISKILGIGADRVHRDRYMAVIELRGKLGDYIRDGHRKKKTRRVEKKGRGL